EARARAGASWVDESGTPFPPETLGPEQEVWCDLLRDGDGTGALLASADPHVPPSSYVAGDFWARMLHDVRPSWARDYHLAVIAHAAGDLSTARAHYAASIAQHSSAWAVRGLARIAAEQGDPSTASDLLRAAVAMAPTEPTLRYESIAAALHIGDAR